MQQRESIKSLRDNYKVPAGQERMVHYTVENAVINPRTQEKEIRREIIKTGVKMFPDVKRNLELQGNTVHILYHPGGAKFYDILPEEPVNPDVKALEEAKREAAEAAAKAEAEKKEKDAEIARLRAELEAAKNAQANNDLPSEKEENTEEAVAESAGESAEAEKKGPGRPRKS